MSKLLWKYGRWAAIGFVTFIISYLLFRFLGKTLQLVITSCFFAASITPLIEEMEKKNINRSWAIGILYSIFLIILVMTVAPAPSIILELGQFFTKFPELVNQIKLPDLSLFGITEEQINGFLRSGVIFDQVQNLGRDLATRTINVTFAIVNILGIVFLTLLFTAYFVINAPNLMPRCLFLLPPKLRLEVELLIPPITKCLGAYVLGKIGTSALLGFLTYLVNAWLNVPYSAALGLLVAVTNLIPFVGPLLGMIPMVIAAWKLGPQTVGIVVGSALTLQNLEAWVLQPWLVGPYLNLDPFELLLSIIVGAELGGITGVLLAPPIAGTGRIIFDYLAKKYMLFEPESFLKNHFTKGEQVGEQLNDHLFNQENIPESLKESDSLPEESPTGSQTNNQFIEEKKDTENF